MCSVAETEYCSYNFHSYDAFIALAPRDPWYRAQENRNFLERPHNSSDSLLDTMDGQTMPRNSRATWVPICTVAVSLTLFAPGIACAAPIAHDLLDELSLFGNRHAGLDRRALRQLSRTHQTERSNSRGRDFYPDTGTDARLKNRFMKEQRSIINRRDHWNRESPQLNIRSQSMQFNADRGRSVRLVGRSRSRS